MFRSAFHGGVHPPENKHITDGSLFSNLSVPGVCYVPLTQHIGASAEPVVQVGDIVAEGQLIGKAAGFVSANVHSPVPGKVTEIRELATIYGKKLGVVIEADGAFHTDWSQAVQNIDALSKEDIISAVKEAGITGLGGASFPTAVKLSPPPDSPVDTLVINGAECEPYLTVDDVLMRTFPSEIIQGIQITMKALGVNKAIIGIEDNKSGAVKAIKDKAAELDVKGSIKVKALRTKYPQGAEKQLIYSLTKRVVPSGGLPAQVGVVVQNVGTIFAIREAALLKKPLYERYITVSGSLINKPGNYKVRIGTLVADIIEDCGGLKGNPAKVIMGGPMCGISLPSVNTPVVKGTSGLLFLSAKEIAPRDYSACIRCGKCVSVCPMGLLPCDLGNAVETRNYDISDKLHPLDCIMCGACKFTCPAGRPLPHFIKLAQNHLRSQKK